MSSARLNAFMSGAGAGAVAGAGTRPRKQKSTALFRDLCQPFGFGLN